MDDRELAVDADNFPIQLLETALYGDSLGLQQEAMRALRDASLSESARRAVIAAASSDCLFVRRRVALILGRDGGPLIEVLPTLLLLLEDPAWSVREAATHGLVSRIRDQRTEVAGAGSAVHDALLSRSIRDRHRLVRDAATGALEKYDDPARTIRQLLDVLPAAKPVIRCRVFLVLARFRHSADKFCDALIAALDDSDRRVRHTVAEILAGLALDSPRVLPALTRRQFDRDCSVGSAARRAGIMHRSLLPARLQVILYDLKSEDGPQAVLNKVLSSASPPADVVNSFVAVCHRRMEWWKTRRADLVIDSNGSQAVDQLASALVGSFHNAADRDREAAWLISRFVELLLSAGS